MAAVGEDDAAWERAIDAATKAASAATSGPKTRTLDGAVKSSTGRLPSPALFKRFTASLEELSIAGACISSLEGMPCLPALRHLLFPDNRLSGSAALAAVVEELEPLAKLGIEALDLEQCPVSKAKGYREKVFALIPSLEYLDGADAEGNECLVTDDEDYVEEEDDEEGEEGEDGEGEEGEEDDGEEGDEEGEEEGEGDDDEEEEGGDEEAEDEEDEADDDELDADADDKENIESKVGSSLPNKRKRDNDDDTNGDN
ncbi:hypothetical protein GQ55_9G136800 [Panicum hallii var. hallii]|uniref:U2A'/phosphoprotein 32 family A C-terminal domain-containing protein n=1 Tax=Panicum hallii var. hallii TaxID=1504633 RepID=A0A2T7C2R7_9POAL|nr:hypothetical protein GQ55_9G136800 [Panicum hallii var. hallii]